MKGARKRAQQVVEVEFELNFRERANIAHKYHSSKTTYLA